MDQKTEHTLPEQVERMHRAHAACVKEGMEDQEWTAIVQREAGKMLRCLAIAEAAEVFSEPELSIQ